MADSTLFALVPQLLLGVQWPQKGINKEVNLLFLFVNKASIFLLT